MIKDWRNDLNRASNNWACTSESSHENSLVQLRKLIRKINSQFQVNLTIPDEKQMEVINQEIGDIEESVSLEELVESWNRILNPNLYIKIEKKLTWGLRIVHTNLNGKHNFFLAEVYYDEKGDDKTPISYKVFNPYRRTLEEVCFLIENLSSVCQMPVLEGDSIFPAIFEGE